MVFDRLTWRLIVRSGENRCLYIHGDPEFERLRAGNDLHTTAERAQSMVIAALVARVEVTTRQGLFLSLGGSGEDREEKAKRRRRARFRKEITEAIVHGSGELGLSQLIRGERPWRQAFTGSDDCSTSLVGSDDEYLDRLLDGVELPVMEGIVLPHLPGCGPDDLRRAVKYMLRAPITLRLIRLRSGSLSVDGGAGARRYLAGGCCGNAPGRARTAVAMTFRFLVEQEDRSSRDRGRDVDLTDTQQRICGEICDAAIAEGIDGLRKLCRQKASIIQPFCLN